jgi:BASS family bile acid:Na+ symporter
VFDQYPRYEYLFAQTQLVLFMAGMGATLTGADFGRVLRRPRSLLFGVAGQFLVTPLVAVLVNRWAGLEPGIAVGLILVAAMPGGPLSKVFAYLGCGNLALSITLTVLGTLATLATVPLLLRTLAYAYVPPEFRMPVGWVVRDVSLYLLLPLALGMGLARLAPARRVTFSRWCLRAGFVVVVVMVTGALGSGRIQPGEYGWRVPLAIIVFCVAAQQLSMLPFRLLGWSKPDCLSVGIEVTMRNMNLALLLKALLFPAAEPRIDPVADGVLFVILFYAATAMGAGLPLALNMRRMIRKERRMAMQQAVEPAAVDE